MYDRLKSSKTILSTFFIERGFLSIYIKGFLCFKINSYDLSLVEIDKDTYEFRNIIAGTNVASDNSGLDIVGYTNPDADKYIEKIRMTKDSEERKTAYLKLQEIMHEDQPVIFLYSPMQKIIISNRIKAVTTSKRPGYLANSFQLSE